MSKRILSFLIVFVILVAGARIVAAQSDEVQIKEVITTYVKMLNAGDADGVIELFMPDVVFMPHGSPAQVGSTAVHAFFRDSLFGQGSIDISFDPVEVVVLDGWAFARVEATGSDTSKDSGKSVKIDNKALFIFRRANSGQWKIARLMWNMNGREQ
jgi:uncharacterized protein (TIGR02246 family)